MNIDNLLQRKAELESNVNDASERLREYTADKRGPMGLIPESAKTDDYKQLKTAYDRAFVELRAFNGEHLKTIRKYA